MRFEYVGKQKHDLTINICILWRSVHKYTYWYSKLDLFSLHALQYIIQNDSLSMLTPIFFDNEFIQIMIFGNFKFILESYF